MRTNNNNRKLSSLQIARLAVQIVFFIILPGMFINAFSGLKEIVTSLLSGNFDFSSNLYQLIEFLVIIPITVLIGRFFCGWMCAFGTIGDILYEFSKKVFKFRFKISQKTDKYLKYLKFVILGFVILFIWILKTVDLSSADPWNVFGIAFKFGQIPNLKYIFNEFTIGAILLAIIIILSLFFERFFCRYLCPLGGIFSLISKITPLKIKKPKNDCGLCKLCTNNCSMGIPLYKYDKVPSGECINCYKCISVCPRNNVSVNIASEDIKPGVATAVAVTAITGFYYAGSIVSKSSDDSTIPVSAYSLNSETSYQDGVYEGSGTGFRGATTKVSVTVSNGAITDIEVLSHGDDAPYFERAYSSVVEQILSLQTTEEIDTVSGATYSSEGIISAVENALAVAKGDTSNSDTDKNAASDEKSEKSNNEEGFHGHGKNKDFRKQSENEKEDSEESNDNSSDNETSTNKSYSDGTYEGSANGFRNGTTTVSVEVENNQIKNIEILSHGDDVPYFEKALSSVVEQIVEEQTTDVDTVSGATYSSKGIMNAVANALSQSE